MEVDTSDTRSLSDAAQQLRSPTKSSVILLYSIRRQPYHDTHTIYFQ